MKIIVYILSIYLLGLSFIPCTDGKEVLNNESSMELVLKTGHSHQDHNPTDSCSLFCQCECCHVHVVETRVSVFLATRIDPGKPSFFHLDNSGWELPKTLLRPPRV